MIREEEITEKALREVAEKMIIAARTAPKARGRNHLFIVLAGKEEIEKIAHCMDQIAGESGEAFFSRDAGDIRQSDRKSVV